jgi:flagellar protein FliO/FliZ
MTPMRQASALVRILVLASAFALNASSARAAEPHADPAGLRPATPRAWLGTAKSPKTAKAATGGGFSLGRAALGLSVMALLAAVALYVKKRHAKDPVRAASQLRVVSSTRVGPRATLVLADVAGRKLLLGVTDSSVRRLAWLDHIEALAAPAELPSSVPSATLALGNGASQQNLYSLPKSGGRSFGELLRAAFGRPARADESAALEIAESTEDVFTPSAKGPLARARAVRMLDVEGQAQGLARRLRERRA